MATRGPTASRCRSIVPSTDVSHAPEPRQRRQDDAKRSSPSCRQRPFGPPICDGRIATEHPHPETTPPSPLHGGCRGASDERAACLRLAQSEPEGGDRTPATRPTTSTGSIHVDTCVGNGARLAQQSPKVTELDSPQSTCTHRPTLRVRAPELGKHGQTPLSDPLQPHPPSLADCLAPALCCSPTLPASTWFHRPHSALRRHASDTETILDPASNRRGDALLR